MKSIFYTITLIALFSACKSSKDYLSRSDGDKALFDAVKKLNKKPSDEEALRALPLLYDRAQQYHTGKISKYTQSSAIGRWDNILSAYTILQNMYDVIIANPSALKMVRPADYRDSIGRCRENAAEAYYQYALSLEANPSREQAILAYKAYRKAAQYIPGYKDTRTRIDAVYEQTIVDVVINPVQQRHAAFNTGFAYNYNNEYFQQTLVRELGYNHNRPSQARFYTDRDALARNIQPDWLVDLVLRRIDMPGPATTQSARNLSREIEAGKDSTGKQLYQTVTATLTIYRQSFSARATMEVSITDIRTRKSIAFNNYDEDYQWQEEYATYSGDRRALGNSDWDLVNNAGFRNTPSREQVINELYRKLYPRIKSRISYAVEW